MKNPIIFILYLFFQFLKAQTYVDPKSNIIFVLDKENLILSLNNGFTISQFKINKRKDDYFVIDTLSNFEKKIIIKDEIVEYDNIKYFLASKLKNYNINIQSLYSYSFNGNFKNNKINLSINYNETNSLIKLNQNNKTTLCDSIEFSKTNFGFIFKCDSTNCEILKDKNDVFFIKIGDKTYKVKKELIEKKYPIKRFGRKPKKPVLYFYPTQNQTITTKINCTKNSKLTFTYPKLREQWKFEATPEGILTFENGKKYNYLFWEGEESNVNYNLEEGFVVKKDNLETFFVDKLEKMGLKQHELNDFIVYWVPILMKNEYNYVNFVISSMNEQNENGETYNQNYNLEIEPKPETMFRIFMIYKPCNQDFKVKEQKLPSFQRKGFTVVEWGGIELSNNCLSGR